MIILFLIFSRRMIAFQKRNTHTIAPNNKTSASPVDLLSIIFITHIRRKEERTHNTLRTAKPAHTHGSKKTKSNTLLSFYAPFFFFLLTLTINVNSSCRRQTGFPNLRPTTFLTSTLVIHLSLYLRAAATFYTIFSLFLSTHIYIHYP